MRREKVEIKDVVSRVQESLPGGILLTTKAGAKTNSMAIGWGTVGIEWGKPIFIAFIRTGRYTHELLEENGEFTVNVPLDGSARKAIGFCGSRSGRNIDKLKEAGLTLVESETVSVPAIAELPLTLECKVIYKQTQIISALPEDIRKGCYPEGVPSEATGSNSDAHTAYYGEITAAYILRP